MNRSRVVVGMSAVLLVIGMQGIVAADGHLAPVVSANSHSAALRTAASNRQLESNGNAGRVAYASAEYASACDVPSVCATADATCSSCQSVVCSCNCTPWWAHRNGGFGELLFLSPGSSDLIYAVEQTGPNLGASPTGPVGISNIQDELGYRVGFNWALSNKSSLAGSYTRWDGDTTTSMTASGTNVLNSLLIHPSVATTGNASLEATAHQSLTFQIADATYRRVYKAYDCGILNSIVGLRYGNLEQGLRGEQTVSVPTGTTTVTTDVDFNGFGIVGGFDGERHARESGLLIYGRTVGSLLSGNWQADYQQVNQFGGGTIANHYEDFRISPMLDAELGCGWQTKGGGLRFTTGYLFSSWFNTVNNRDYIQAVRNGTMLDLNQALTFSGLTFRTEMRF